MKKYFLLFFILFINFGIVCFEKGVVTSNVGLVLRSKASTNSSKIMTIPDNAEVIVINKNGPSQTIYGITSKWYKIRYKTKTGWVFGGFINIITPNVKQNVREKPVNETDNKKVDNSIIGLYKMNYDQVKPILKLEKDGTFLITFNMCDGMQEAIGKYTVNGKIITAVVAQCKDCFDNAGFSGMKIEFKIISNSKLQIMNEVVRYKSDQKLGFCAPYKNAVFIKN